MDSHSSNPCCSRVSRTYNHITLRYRSIQSQRWQLHNERHCSWSPPPKSPQYDTQGLQSYLPCPPGNRTHHSRTLLAPLTLPSRNRIWESHVASPSGTTSSGRCHCPCCLLKSHPATKPQTKGRPSLKSLWPPFRDRGPLPS